jgi:4-alpha-glucanotransferase
MYDLIRLYRVTVQNPQFRVKLSLKVITFDIWQTGAPIMTRRKSGILIPLFSLPGRYGMGDIESMYKFISQVSDTGIDLIQLLPLNALGGDETSPYSSISAFACHPLYISLKHLPWMDELPEERPSGTRVDYKGAYEAKMPALKRSYELFIKQGTAVEQSRFESFCEKNNHWLPAYSVFHTLFETHKTAFWEWPEEHQDSENAMKNKELLEKSRFYQFLQWVFFEQWQELKLTASESGISFMGDLPLYVSENSSDHWERPELFKKGVHAGVPPDLYSEEGQDWGNPIYDWKKMEASGFQWWKNRVLWLSEFCSAVRVDHFRGIYSYWEVQDGHSPKETKDWTDGPKTGLIKAISDCGITLIGEDLGFIPEEVETWINEMGIPGYRVFIFGWGFYSGEEDYGSSKYSFPENYPRESMACTTTHDSESLMEFLEDLEEMERFRLAGYLGYEEGRSFTLRDLCWKMIEKVLSCPSKYCIIPLQDILGKPLRINLPGTVSPKNWSAVIDWSSPEDKESLSNFKGFIRRLRK